MLVIGTAVLAMSAGAAVAFDSSLFKILLFADLWLLGYHHVIATYARIAAEADGFRRHRALITWVPVAVALAVVALAFGIGAWTLPTIYLYWQWWHYTRQSYGVGQLYRLKTGQTQRTLIELKAVVFGLPLAGILYRSYQAPAKFLGMELRVLPMPAEAVVVAAVGAAVVIAWWALRQLQAWRAGELAPAYTLYLLTHLAVFGVGYFAFSDINHGWLVINSWHNAQYLLIVSLFNSKRFGNEVNPAQRLMSTLSLRRNRGFYFMTTFGVSTLAYLALTGGLSLVSASAISLTLVAYQVINFHHYIVDSLIWKVRRPQVRDNLGLAEQAA